MTGLNLNSLIETNVEGHVKRHESTVVEYKANFSYGAVTKYAKTMAAFANNRGGVIVFGVTNSPRVPKGMTNENWMKLDPAKLSGDLNQWFSPEIMFNLEDLVTEDGKRFAFIVVEESNNKPVIMQQNKGDILKDGDIYYRYNGRSTTIRHPELAEIISGVRRREQKLWMSHIQRISKIGVDKAAVFDPNDGLVKGSRGSFLISKELLPSLNFIKDGEFVEKEGSPTITLFGSAEIVSGDSGEGLIGIAEKAITENDVFVNFLNRISVQSPLEYLKACLSSNAKYMPIYYYMKLAGMNLKELSGFIGEVHGFKKFEDRLSEDENKLRHPLKATNSSAYKEKRQILDQIQSNSVEIQEESRWLRKLFVVLRTLEDPEMIRGYLLQVYKLPLRKLNVISDFRYAACYLDFIENRVER
ncbi:MAG: ATP-binding protein [Candidatus Thiodiazotropha sp. (ex Semelilucina semeliformis)]|nr:ATP-binding protein [Candidatus Thiodiazotropha sp. (ex Semelilucina semeliformis)]